MRYLLIFLLSFSAHGTIDPGAGAGDPPVNTTTATSEVVIEDPGSGFTTSFSNFSATEDQVLDFPNARGNTGDVLTTGGANNLLQWLPPVSSGGDVVGPASSVDRVIPIFDGVTGKLIQESSPAASIDTFGNLYTTATNPASNGVVGNLNGSIWFGLMNRTNFTPNTNNGDYAILQSNSGATLVNSVGQDLAFRRDGATIMRTPPVLPTLDGQMLTANGTAGLTEWTTPVEIPFTYAVDTFFNNGCPANAGIYRRNNVDPLLATQISFRNVAASALRMVPEFNGLRIGDRITLHETGTPNHNTWDVTAVAVANTTVCTAIGVAATGGNLGTLDAGDNVEGFFQYVAGGTGGVHPVTTVNNAIARYDGTTGDLQNSGLEVNDVGDLDKTTLGDFSIRINNIARVTFDAGGNGTVFADNITSIGGIAGVSTRAGSNASFGTTAVLDSTTAYAFNSDGVPGGASSNINSSGGGGVGIRKEGNLLEAWASPAQVYTNRVYHMDDKSNNSASPDPTTAFDQILMTTDDVRLGVIFDRSLTSAGERFPILFRGIGGVYRNAFKMEDNELSFVAGNDLDPTNLGIESFRVNANGRFRLGNAFDLPMADGNANEVLTTDGAGDVSWQAAPPAANGVPATAHVLFPVGTCPASYTFVKTQSFGGGLTLDFCSKN